MNMKGTRTSAKGNGVYKQGTWLALLEKGTMKERGLYCWWQQ